jgi:hypothetical protein
MAEEFVIRVQLEGEGRAPRSGSGSNLGAGIPLAASTSLLATIKDPQTAALVKRTTDLIEKGGLESGMPRSEYDLLKIKRGLFRTKVIGQYAFEEINENPETFQDLGMTTGGIKDVNFTVNRGFVQENFTTRRLATAGVATAFKIAQSGVQLVQHRSGNSHFNKELNNYMRLGSIGTSVAATATFVGGPAAVFVAAGIAFNETVNAFVDAANYNYDRRLDTMMVHNMKEVSGNLSYGRRGGTR